MNTIETEGVVAHVLEGTEKTVTVPESRDSGGVIEERTGWALLDVAGFTDGGGQLVIGCLELQGNTTYNIVEIFNPAGALVRRVQVAPPGFADGALEKFDATTMIPNGRNIMCVGTTHKAISDANRTTRKVYYVIENAITERGPQQVPPGLAFDARTLGGSDPAPLPGGTGPTLDQIAGVINNAISSLVNGLEQHVKNGTQAGLDASLQRGSLKDAFAAQGVTGDSLARAFWQEPFASRFRKLLKDAPYEMGAENNLWGLGSRELAAPVPDKQKSAQEIQEDATRSAARRALGRGMTTLAESTLDPAQEPPAEDAPAEDAPAEGEPSAAALLGQSVPDADSTVPQVGPLAARRRVRATVAQMGKSLSGPPAPQPETPADAPPTTDLA